MISRLQQGVDLPPARPLGRDGQPLPVPKPVGPPERSAPAEVRVLKFTSRHTWAEIRLHEGKNRQIHRMAEAIGSSLLKLVRVEYAGLTASGVDLGAARPLTPREVSRLRLMCGLSATLPRAAHVSEEKERSRPGWGPGPRGDRPPRSDRGETRERSERPSRPARTERGGSDRPAPRGAGARFEDRPPPRFAEGRPAPRRGNSSASPPARKLEDRPSSRSKFPRSRPNHPPPPVD